MLQALLASVASIKAQQARMNVIGNNLANVNTTAFKGSRVNFQDMVSQTLRGANRPSGNRGGTNPIQYGLGVLLGGTDLNVEQGSLNATNRPSDLAIQGAGFFMVGDGQQTMYTRDGGFDLDAEGNLVHKSTGLYVLGWGSDPNGKIDVNQQVTAADKLNIPFGTVTALQVTTTANFAGNLKSDAAATDTFTATINVYDSLGATHKLTMKVSNHQVPAAAGGPAGSTSSWDWEVFDGEPPVSVGSSESAGNSQLFFDSNGKLLNPSAANVVTVPGSSGSVPFPVSMDFSKLVQQSGNSSMQAVGQNGFPPGALNGFGIGSDGTITGSFTNGLSRTLGRVATATFANAGGMQRIGNNLWSTSGNSGEPQVGSPSQGGHGSVTPGFLEQSNVDIGSEFTDLIVTQRGFQANTRVVTTVDEMLQDLLNMKR